MIKRYDNHSGASQVKLLFFVWPGLLLIYASILSNRMPPLGDLIAIFAFFSAGIVVSVVAYMRLRRMYIEISDEDICYRGLRKKVLSPWHGVRELRVLGRTHKVFTVNGSFSFGYMEHAGGATRGWLRTVKDMSKYTDELVNEIKKRAPQARITYGPFVRPS